MNNCRQHKPLESAQKLISRRRVQKGNEAIMAARSKQKINGWSVMKTTGIARIPMTLLVIARATIGETVDPVATRNDTVSLYYRAVGYNVLYHATGSCIIYHVQFQ
jgi:hypothetical protein